MISKIYNSDIPIWRADSRKGKTRKQIQQDIDYQLKKSKQKPHHLQCKEWNENIRYFTDHHKLVIERIIKVNNEKNFLTKKQHNWFIKLLNKETFTNSQFQNMKKIHKKFGIPMPKLYNKKECKTIWYSQQLKWKSENEYR